MEHCIELDHMKVAAGSGKHIYVPDPLTTTLDAVNVLWVERGKGLKRERKQGQGRNLGVCFYAQSTMVVISRQREREFILLQ